MTDLPKNKDTPSTEGMTGTCLCESITVHIKQSGLFDSPNGHICHCRNCRKSSGSSHINILCIASQNVSLSDPKALLKTYSDTKTGSGKPTLRSFCSNCGSPVGAFPMSMDPRISGVCLGLFEKIPEPQFEVFVKDRVDWGRRATDGCEQFLNLEGCEKYFAKLLE